MKWKHPAQYPALGSPGKWENLDILSAWISETKEAAGTKLRVVIINLSIQHQESGKLLEATLLWNFLWEIYYRTTESWRLKKTSKITSLTTSPSPSCPLSMSLNTTSTSFWITSRDSDHTTFWAAYSSTSLLFLRRIFFFLISMAWRRCSADHSHLPGSQGKERREAYSRKGGCIVVALCSVVIHLICNLEISNLEMRRCFCDLFRGNFPRHEVC